MSYYIVLVLCSRKCVEDKIHFGIMGRNDFFLLKFAYPQGSLHCSIRSLLFLIYTENAVDSLGCDCVGPGSGTYLSDFRSAKAICSGAVVMCMSELDSLNYDVHLRECHHFYRLLLSEQLTVTGIQRRGNGEWKL